jgi:hypothetical protein
MADAAIALIYVDTSDVREGALSELKDAIADLARFVEDNEPDLIAYNVYFSDDGRQMSVVHVHRDAASLDFHLEVAGAKFARFATLLDMRSIVIYGTPSPEALAQLGAKSSTLGSGGVTVMPRHAGFARAGQGD